MARNAAQRDVFSVEEKTFFRIDKKAAQAERKNDFISLTVRSRYTGGAGIQSRGAQPVPQYRVGQQNFCVWRASRGFGTGCRGAVRRGDLIADLGVVAVNEVCFNGKVPRAIFIQYGCKQYALCPIIGQIEMCVRDTNEVHISVQAVSYTHLIGNVTSGKSVAGYMMVGGMIGNITQNVRATNPEFELVGAPWPVLNEGEQQYTINPEANIRVGGMAGAVTKDCLLYTSIPNINQQLVHLGLTAL